MAKKKPKAEPFDPSWARPEARPWLQEVYPENRIYLGTQSADWDKIIARALASDPAIAERDRLRNELLDLMIEFPNVPRDELKKLQENGLSPRKHETP